MGLRFIFCAMLLSLLLLMLPPLATAEYKELHISLVPRDYIDPRTEDNFICGLNTNIDERRLLAEQNSAYLFDVFDNSKDEANFYKTEIFDVISFNSVDQPQIMSDGERFKNKTGLYSLFIVPARQQCNIQTFEDAASEGRGFYPVYVGVSNVFEESAVLEKFRNGITTMKKNFPPKEKNPKLCGSLTPMLPINEIVAISQQVALTKVFNFLYNEEREAAQFSSSSYTECRTWEETFHSIREKFKEGEISFEKSEEEVNDHDGFVEITMTRQTCETTSVAHIEVINESADNTDFVPFKGPIVFMEGKKTTSFFMRLKSDNDTNRETYSVKIKPVNTRVKRGGDEAAEVKSQIIIAPNLNRFISFCKSCPRKIVDGAHWLYNYVQFCDKRRPKNDPAKPKPKQKSKPKQKQKLQTQTKTNAQKKLERTLNNALSNFEDNKQRLENRLEAMKQQLKMPVKPNFHDYACRLKAVCEEEEHDLNLEYLNNCNQKLTQADEVMDIFEHIVKAEQINVEDVSNLENIESIKECLDKECPSMKKKLKSPKTKTKMEDIHKMVTTSVEQLYTKIKTSERKKNELYEQIDALLGSILSDIEEETVQEISKQRLEIDDEIKKIEQLNNGVTKSIGHTEEKCKIQKNNYDSIRKQWTDIQVTPEKQLTSQTALNPVKLDYATSKGPFRARDTNQFPISVNGAIKTNEIVDQPRTQYSSWFSKTLHIPLTAIIKIDGATIGAFKNMQSLRVRPQDKLPRERANLINQFTTDLRDGVRPMKGKSNQYDKYDPPLLDGDYEDYVNTWTYYDAREKDTEPLTRGHLIAAKTFLHLFQTPVELQNPDPVYDAATYMTNVFPQYRRKRPTDKTKQNPDKPIEYNWSTWDTHEEKELEDAKKCMRNRERNKFFIAHGTVPGAKTMPGTNVNVPGMFMAYCCSEESLDIVKLIVFEQHTGYVNPDGRTTSMNDKILHKVEKRSETAIKDFIEKIEYPTYIIQKTDNIILHELQQKMIEADCFSE